MKRAVPPELFAPKRRICVAPDPILEELHSIRRLLEQLLDVVQRNSAPAFPNPAAYFA